MPASYAHYRFGRLLLPELPGDVRRCIQRFRRMYDTGLQGPDFFFYFSPGMNTATYELGDSFHRQSGQVFFTAACAAADSEAARAYLYGVLAHYCLDSLIHPVVDRLDASGSAKHTPLESAFDRFLLDMDGVSPAHTFNRGGSVRLTRGESMTVAGMYPGTTGGKVCRSVSLMSLCLRLLSHPNRKLQELVLNRMAPQYLDYRIPTEDSELMKPLVAQLYSLYQQALAVYPAMLEELTEHLSRGQAFSDAFLPPFG